MTAATSTGRRRNLIENFQSNHDRGSRGQRVGFGSLLTAQRDSTRDHVYIFEITALLSAADNFNPKKARLAYQPGFFFFGVPIVNATWHSPPSSRSGGFARLGRTEIVCGST
jgi:hypothetical protein